MTVTVNPYPNDPVNEDILATAGSDIIYRSATGLEKALADVESQRLIAIYAELIRDQWDPYRISRRNLPWLAWALGVNLWESWWSEEFQRYWVAQQWTLKTQRGSLVGLERFVRAVGSEVKHVYRPPAITYTLRSDTPAERAAYVARFPQLRLYPYVARVMLPWLCYSSSFPARGAFGSVSFVNNPQDGHTVTFGVRTIIFGTDVTIGVDLAATMANLIAWLAANPDPGLLAYPIPPLAPVVGTVTLRAIELMNSSPQVTPVAYSPEGQTTSFPLENSAPELGAPQLGQNSFVDFAFIAETNTIALTAKSAGIEGNSYKLATTAIGATVSSNVLSGGKDASGSGTSGKNGSFVGPLRPIFPTVQNQGGNYTRTSKLWDRGTETTLTMRKIERVTTGGVGWGFTPGVYAYDEEIVLPLDERICLLQNGRYLGGGEDYGVFPNATPKLRTITIARSGPLELSQGKAIYQTVVPQVPLLKLEPELVTVAHPIRSTELYASRKQYLTNKFLPPSNAWQFLYERWYLFDADRVPDYRRRGVYLDHTRLGMEEFSAEAKIQIITKMPRYKAHVSNYVYGFLSEPDYEPINRVRRAVNASKAVRDTILIDTKHTRVLQVGDIIRPDGRYTVGQLVEA